MINHRATKTGDRVAIQYGTRSMLMNCSFDQYSSGINKYNQGARIQDAFPFLDKDEREFLVSGLTPEDWRFLFGDEED